MLRPGPSFLALRLVFAILIPLLFAGALRAASWTRGTGLFNDINLGALENASVVQRNWPQVVNYDLNLNTWRYDVFVPENYDGSKPYGVMIYITSDGVTGTVLQNMPRSRDVIWIAPRYVGNGAYSPDRYGAGLLAAHRAKELFNIDPRRIYNSGKSGGARTASALAFYHSEIFRGTAPSAGFSLPRRNEVSPDYIPNTSGQSDGYFEYSGAPFNYYFFTNNALHNTIYTTAKANKLRSYIIGRYDDYREVYFVEAFHCAFEPQGLDCSLYNGPGGHWDPSDAEMEEAIDYLDRDDTFPVNANITAGPGGFSGPTGLTDISQSGASAVEATSGGDTTYTLAPTLAATAAAKTTSPFYWDNRHGSTLRWLWEVKDAAPANQKTSFGLWFADETWGGGAPTSVTAASNPGILITITQNGTQNRLVVSARPDTGGETIFYDGTFSFVPAYSTAWTGTQTGYLAGTGSPVEFRLDINQRRWQLSFNGIVLDGAINTIASGTQRSRDNKLLAFGYWDTPLGRPFWKHDPNTSALNTWSPFTKSIFTAATGALSGTGAAPAPMELRYVIASDPGLPDPLPPGPTGIAATAAYGTLRLAWNAHPGATSYTVKRGTTSLGPYATLASGVTATSYTDATAQSGVLYYYTVSAHTASGETANGTEAAAGLNALRLRSTGGTASNGTNTTGAEGADKAFDGTLAKWFNGTGATDWLQYRFPAGKLYPLHRYIIASGNDVPGRDPVAWEILGSNDGVNWTTLDTRSGQSFPARLQPYAYDVSPAAAYEYYRLNITANGGATGIQLTELQLLSADLVVPVITAPSDILVGSIDGDGEVVNFTATATDDEDGPVAVVCTPPSGSFFPFGSTTVVCTASDSSGNHTQTSFVVTVNDDTVNDLSPPVITVPDAITVPATSAAGASVTFTTSAFDAMDGARPTASTPASGSVFPVGTTTVTTTASDTKGNTATRTFTVTVQPFIQTRAWLKFDETSGVSAADASGNNWTGTLVGGPTWTAGRLGNAVSLSGATQYVTLPTGVVNGITACTFSAWVNLNSTSNWQRIFDFGTGTTNYLFLSPRNGANSRLRFAITTTGGNGEQRIDGTATLPTGGWQHVAVVLNGATGTLYVNGVQVGQNTAMTLTPSSLGATTNNYLGKSQFNDPYLNGAVDDFRIIAQALSAQQVAALAAPPAPPPSLTAASGDAQVSLGWAAVTGAVSYNVKRSLVAGGPYAFVANTTATSFTDTGLANGTTYRYVVTALNAVTESLGSTEAAATPLSALQQWRLAHFGIIAATGDAADAADPDGDGMTNAQEYAAGTVPTDAASVLRASIEIDGTDIVVSFPSVAGRTYRIESSDTLAAGSWTTLLDDIDGTGGVLEIADPDAAGAVRRFYRIVLLP